jgi:hypothetical protein
MVEALKVSQLALFPCAVATRFAIPWHRLKAKEHTDFLPG